MEEINESVKSLKQKLKKLSDFIALSLKRNDLGDELRSIQLHADKVGILVIEAQTLMQSDLENIQEKCESTMTQMRNIQTRVVDHILKEKLEKTKIKHDAQKQEHKAGLAGGDNASNITPFKAPKAHSPTFNPLPHYIAPVMRIVEYKESPLIKRKINSVPIKFSDFNARITQDHFERLPRYMCGRETLGQLNNFLENVIIECFNEKYQLMYKPRSSVRKPQDLDTWKVYNLQASYLPGEHFITNEDIAKKLNKTIDKKTQNRLVILRHIRILHEIRINKTVCYIWTA